MDARTQVTHIMISGQVLCRFTNLEPQLWPEGHVWVPKAMAFAASCPDCQRVHKKLG